MTKYCRIPTMNRLVLKNVLRFHSFDGVLLLLLASLLLTVFINIISALLFLQTQTIDRLLQYFKFILNIFHALPKKCHQKPCHTVIFLISGRHEINLAQMVFWCKAKTVWIDGRQPFFLCHQSQQCFYLRLGV